MKDLEWTEKESTAVRTFIGPFEDEMIYVIKGGHKDTYIVVHDDAHEMTLGQTNVLSAEGVKKRYNIDV
tara:strand:- start:318 stop:524 length:207 start_codon:yes stop_codon:yes gene_type:complete